ncbi:MAG: alpha/beta hydrolase [Clostridia bacterium]|nr:alpha/beta hydrolase [Clostridia bacterium]
MSFLADRQRRKIFIIATAILLSLAIVVGACAIYVSDCYRADLDAIHAFAPMNAVAFEALDDGVTVFQPPNATKGLIFYPGGKVEHLAYQPLMAACAEKGILCVLVQMPCNLAVLDINAADGIQDRYPEIEDWYIGGHSLGGSMAASYLARHADAYQGLILLGSYSTADLSDTALEVLSVYGSEDRVMNKEKYDKNKANLPQGFTEVVIDGGCHAYFGMYGAQDGDGVPTISNEEQIAQTAAAIADLMK